LAFFPAAVINIRWLKPHHRTNSIVAPKVGGMIGWDVFAITFNCASDKKRNTQVNQRLMSAHSRDATGQLVFVGR
jgi:hypothetical protein